LDEAKGTGGCYNYDLQDIPGEIPYKKAMEGYDIVFWLEGRYGRRFFQRLFKAFL